MGLLFWFHLHVPGLLCTWSGKVGGSRLNLLGTNNSHGPQTPGSRPACDTGRQRLSAKLLWKPSGDFTDSDSDDFEEAEGRFFRVSWEKPQWKEGAGRRWELPSFWSVPSSSVSSHAALTSSSSSAACSARCSRPLHRLPPSSTRDSCLIQVRPMLPWLSRGRGESSGQRLCRGPRPRFFSPTESGYAEQLFQFLQATAQEEGFFGESAAASPDSLKAGEGLPVAAAPCWSVTTPTPGRRAAGYREGLHI